jgi:hypothetical protein
MAPRILRICFATLAVSTALTVAACGSNNKSGVRTVGQADNGEAGKAGPQVMKDAVAAMTAAGAVHMTGVGTQGKPPEKFTVDGHVQSDGLAISEKSAGRELGLIAIGKTTYLKGSAGDVSDLSLPGALSKYANRWVKMSDDSSDDTGSSSLSLASTDDPPTLAGFGKQLSDPDDGVRINARVTKVTLNGQPAVLVTESDGSSFTVAASGTPYLLKAFKAASKNDEEDGSGTLTFSEYGKRVVIHAPADAVDLGSLLKQNPDALLPSPLPSGFPTDFPTG